MTTAPRRHHARFLVVALAVVGLLGACADQGDPDFQAKAGEACAEVLTGVEDRFESTLRIPYEPGSDLAEYDAARAEQTAAFNEASDQIDAALADLHHLDAPGDAEGTFEDFIVALTDVSDLAEQSEAYGPPPSDLTQPAPVDMAAVDTAASEQDGDHRRFERLADELRIDCG